MFFENADRENARERANNEVGNDTVENTLIEAWKDHRGARYTHHSQMVVTAFRKLPEPEKFSGHTHELELEYSPNGYRAIYGVSRDSQPTLFAN